MSPTPEELYKTLMRTRVMIWDRNIARLRRKSSDSAPLHLSVGAPVERGEILKLFKRMLKYIVSRLLTVAGANSWDEWNTHSLKV